ncbi:hypothetical protein SAMN05444342_3225 [Haladaptatus paucihalophilus DX253]|uniref:Uncharacterized protein n=2 Tax=Haladaptatus paucihalophilus TaxID=367189 RepID=A0A1M6YNT9_HALPU|nr:hypothetical protein SAMN05444342_3225 [Haladaptatus paucihalophilus DX253]
MNAEDYPELMSSLIDLASDFGFDEELKENAEVNQQHPHLGLILLHACCTSLQDLDELSQLDNYEPASKFIDKLDNQDFLSNASSIILFYLASDREFLLRYGRAINQDIPRAVAELRAISNSESISDPDHLVDVFRPWGSLCETSIAPLTVVLGLLENKVVDFEKPKDMSFRDSVDQVRSFPTLEPLGKRLDIDLRNSLSHGGPDGGYSPNPITNQIQFWFKKNGKVQTRSMNFAEFEECVVETLSAVVALSLLPLYIISTHACIEVSDFQDC